MSRIGPMDFSEEAPKRSKWLAQVAHDFWDRTDPQRNRMIPLARLKERLLETEHADQMPNALVIQLLKKADENSDGYLDYEEYMKFTESATRDSRTREAFSKAALVVVPRNERTVDKRTYLQHFSCCPPPLFMILTTLVEAGVFIYYMIDMGETMTASGPAPIYSPLIYNPFRRYEAWRYLTYCLIHSGYMHLINNLIVQGVLGVALELVHGAWRVALIYVSGVLFGCLSQSIADPTAYLAGASAGVFAVEYAHVGNILLNWSQMQFRWLQLVIILVLSISDLSFAIWDTYYNEVPSKTGHMAHLGGTVAGMTVGVYILRNFEKRKWEKFCWWFALVLFLILVTVGVVLNATLKVPEYFPDDDHSDIGQARIDYFKHKGQ